MEREIIWLDQAVSSYFDILNYIEDSFGLISAEKFIHQVSEIIDILIDFPLIGKVEFDLSSIRCIIIANKTTLYYTIDGNKIVLLNFFDHRQNPRNKLKSN